MSDIFVYMGRPFRIYAVPRGADGRYHFVHGKVYVKQFASEPAMVRYWNEA